MAERYSMWEAVPEGEPGPGWVELDDNGWGALIGWVAGAGNLRRSPVNDSARTVTGSCISRDGTVVDFEVSFTAEDRAMVDDFANAYLAEAGVEKRPERFCWFVRLPEGFSSWEEFRSAVTGAVYDRDPKALHASDVRSAMEQAIRPLYEGRA